MYYVCIFLMFVLRNDVIHMSRTHTHKHNTPVSRRNEYVCVYTSHENNNTLNTLHTLVVIMRLQHTLEYVCFRCVLRPSSITCTNICYAAHRAWILPSHGGARSRSQKSCARTLTACEWFCIRFSMRLQSN